MLLNRKLRRAFSQPITFIGSESVQNAVNATSITINKPADTREGDLMIVLLFSHDFNEFIFEPTDPDWNLFIASHFDSITRHCDVFYKTVAASETSSFTFNYVNSRLMAGTILTYRNAQIGFRGEMCTGNSTTLIASEIKIPVNNSLLMSIAFTDDAAISFSTPSDMSLLIAEADATKPSYRICSQEINSGLTNAKTTTYTGTTGYGVLFSLIPKNYTARTITYIGSANTQSISSGVSALTINKPTDTIEDDLMIAFLSTTSAESWTGDSGWTEILDQGTKPSMRIAYKIATASEPSSYTFSTGTTTTTPTGSILTFRNALYDTISSMDTNANPITLPSITAIDNYGLLLAYFAANQINKTATTPTYMDQLIIDNDSTAPSYAIFSQQVGYGGVGFRSSSLDSASDVGGVMLTLKLN